MKQIRPIAFIAALFLSLLCQAQEMIRISTSDHEMVMAAFNDGPVHFVYWGEKVQGDAFPFQPGKNQPDTQDDMTSRIYPSYGGRHYLTPALRLTHSECPDYRPRICRAHCECSGRKQEGNGYLT